MFQLGFKKQERQHVRSESKNYLTSSPFVRPIVYDAIVSYANEIELAYNEALLNLNGRKQKNLVATIALVELYKQLDFDSDSDAFKAIAATVWKRVCDLTTQKQEERVQLKSDIGHLLEQQFRYFWVEKKIGELGEILKTLDDTDSKAEQLRKIIQIAQQRLDSVTDNHATLNQRIERSDNLLMMRDESDLRRGYEENLIPDLFPPEWENFAGFGREIVGSVLLDLLCVPKNVEESPGDTRPFKIVKPEGKGDIVKLRECFTELIAQIQEKLKEFTYSKLPLVEPPKPWTFEPGSGCRNNTGGFHTEGLRGLEPLIRYGGGVFETIPSQLTIDLLNNLQTVEWAMDRPQLEMTSYISDNWSTDYDGIPRPSLMTNQDLRLGTGPAIIYPEVQFRDNPENKDRADKIRRTKKNGPIIGDDKAFDKEWRLNNKKLKDLYRKIEEGRKKFGQFVQIQTRFADYTDKFWFAWNLDSRSRIYPIVGLGSPQGGPCERYSLRFHNAHHLSPDGEKNALRAIGAAAEGTKGSITSRIQWAENHLDLIRAVGVGDDESIRLADGFDEPLQLIQLCRQWVAHENGEAWSAPIYADATNSGFQIVAGLMNSSTGLRKTNVCSKTEDDEPNDAYSECREQVVEWLHDKKVELKINWELRHEIIKVMTDPKKGRKLSKCYGRTAIYGSSHISQTRDLHKELESQGVTFGETLKDHSNCVGVLNSLISRAYKRHIGDVMTYNRGIKAMATERFWRGVKPEIVAAVKALCDERKQLTMKDKDLSDKKITELLNLGRQLYRRCSLSGTMPDGTIVDFRRFFVEKMKIRTAFHGNPMAVHTHKDALDVTEMIKATPPGIIHNLDSLILKHAYHDCPYDFTLIHDSAGCHPNNFTDLCSRYRYGFAKTMETNVIDSLAQEWDVEDQVGKFSPDESWKDEIKDAIYLFN